MRVAPHFDARRTPQPWRQKLEKARIFFRSTADVYDSFEKWNVEALQKRSEILAEFAVGRWPGDF